MESEHFTSLTPGLIIEILSRLPVKSLLQYRCFLRRLSIPKAIHIYREQNKLADSLLPLKEAPL
uniref:F-box domain-containing protein n=1 Tax=Solanum tuberosum TaxID=4113 RepID=M1CWH6_SOLTU